MPFQSPFNAIRNQFRANRINIADGLSTDGASGTLATAQFGFNASTYPDGTTFRFTGVLHVSSGTLTGQVQLYNLTDGEVVTSTTLTTSSTTPAIVLSSTLTVGAAAGNLKTSTKVYEVRLSVSGGVAPTDIVYLGSVALVVD